MVIQDFRIEDSSPCFYREPAGTYQAQFIGPSGKAPDSITAHFSFGTIRVKNTHTEIRLLGGQNKNNAIRTDAEMSVTNAFTLVEYRFQVIHMHGINKYEVIAASIPLSKMH